MKIDNGLKGIGGSRAQEVKARKGGAPARGKDSQTAGESVDLTSTAAKLNALESMLADVEVIDTNKVEAVRQAIAEGRFQVNAEAIAERLLENIVEGLKQQRKS